MLVPSPTEDVKALIGDKNADEVSDLSEAEGDSNNDNETSSESSDDDDEHPNDATDVPNVLIQNKSIIGGKNHLIDLVETKNQHQDNQDFESITSQTSLSEAKNNIGFFEEDYIKIERAVIELERQTATSTDEPEASQHEIENDGEVIGEKLSSPNNFMDEHKNLDDDAKPFRPIPAPRSR